MGCEFAYGEFCFKSAVDEAVDIIENCLIFIFHVNAHFSDVFIKELYDDKCQVITARTVDRTQQFATYVRQNKIKKIAVRAA